MRTGDGRHWRGERKEAMSEKECSGNNNTLMMRGAGGETHSDVVYGPTEPMTEPMTEPTVEPTVERARGGRRK